MSKKSNTVKTDEEIKVVKTDEEIIEEMLFADGDFYHRHTDKVKGLKEVGRIGKVIYEMWTPDRTTFAHMRALYQVILDGLPDDSPIYRSDVDEYTSIVHCASIKGLETMSGKRVEFPKPFAGKDAHKEAFEMWMKISAPLATAISGRMASLNAPPVPRQYVPIDHLTDKEKTDPNS